MPRNYNKRVGSRPYGQSSYDRAILQETVSKILSGEQTQREASRYYGIPRGTLQNHVKGVHINNPGAPTALSPEEELIFVAHIQAIGNWGYPVNGTDIRYLVKSYLELNERRKFKENLPGIDWLIGFLKKHKIRLRQAENISTKRFKLSREDIISYFDNLTGVLENVPPENIINYDNLGLGLRLKKQITK